jgi:hypothetical protein
MASRRLFGGTARSFASLRMTAFWLVVTQSA